MRFCGDKLAGKVASATLGLGRISNWPVVCGLSGDVAVHSLHANANAGKAKQALDGTVGAVAVVAQAKYYASQCTAAMAIWLGGWMVRCGGSFPLPSPRNECRSRMGAACDVTPPARRLHGGRFEIWTSWDAAWPSRGTSTFGGWPSSWLHDTQQQDAALSCRLTLPATCNTTSVWID